MGAVDRAELPVKPFAELLERARGAGAARLPHALGSRTGSMCRRDVQLGWMPLNLAEVTGSPEVKMERRRLNGIEEFNAIPAVAPQVIERLANAMPRARERASPGDSMRTAAADGRCRFSDPSTRENRRSYRNLTGAATRPAGYDAQRSGRTMQIHRHRVQEPGSPRSSSCKRPQKRCASPLANSVTPSLTCVLAGIEGDDAPTFHDIRGLARQLYSEQRSADARALLGNGTYV